MMTIPSRIKPPVCVGPNPAHSLAGRLTGCWLLNEGAGRVVRDVSGQRHDGSFSGGPLWTPGVCGPAVEFDGSDDWIGMGNCLNLGTDDVTLLVLVRYSAANQPEQWQGEHIGAIAGKGHLCPSHGYGLSVGSGNKIYWQVRNQSTLFSVASDSALNDGRWHTVIGVCDRDHATGVRLYIDGVQQAATADPTAIAAVNLTDATAFAIGSRQDAGGVWAWDFLGHMAVVYVWKRVLTDAEISGLQREPFGLFARGWMPARLVASASTFVDLAGSAEAVSFASATLQAVRGLSGLCTAHAMTRAVLRKTNSILTPAGRLWRKDVLSYGVSAASFKLGTTLTLGWFWTRRRGGAAVYRGPSLSQVEDSRILHVTGPQSHEVVLPAHLVHPPGSTYCYLVRRFSSCGAQEKTNTSVVMVRLGADEQLAPPAPNAVLDLQAEQIPGGKLRLTWHYEPLDQATAPQEFHVYGDHATGWIDLEHPLVAVPYAGRKVCQYVTEPLGMGLHTFAVRAHGSNGSASLSLASVVCFIASFVPEAPTVVRAEAM